MHLDVKVLNQTEISLIGLLAKGRPLTREEIAKALNSSAATIYHALSRLIAWGYVSATKPKGHVPGRPKLVYSTARPVSDIALAYLESLGAGDLLLATEILGGPSIVDVRGLPEEYVIKMLSERLNYEGPFSVLADNSQVMKRITALCKRRSATATIPKQVSEKLWLATVR